VQSKKLPVVFAMFSYGEIQSNQNIVRPVEKSRRKTVMLSDGKALPRVVWKSGQIAPSFSAKDIE